MSHPASPRRERRSLRDSRGGGLWGLWIPIALAIVYALHCRFVYYVSDDGFIGFRYVQNFLAGCGPVYNVGERVEGYTNFLWLALLAATQWSLPGLDLLRISQAFGVLFGAAAVVLTCRFARRFIAQDGPPVALAGAFLAVHTSFVAWSTSGLETLMFALLLFAGAFAHCLWLEDRSSRVHLLSALLFGLLPMVRPDGLLLSASTGLHLLVSDSRRRGKLAIRRPLAWAVVCLGVYAAYYVWRLNYYGQPFPNTFYAKVLSSGDQYAVGWRYLERYVWTHGALVFVPALAMLLRRERSAWRDYFALLVGTYTAYVVYVGGDGLAFFRFFAHVAPLVYLLVSDGYVGLYRYARRRVSGVPEWVWWTAASAVVVVSLGYTTRQSAGPLLWPERYRWYERQSELNFPGVGSDHSYVWFDNYFVERQALAAKWLERNAAPDSLVASTPAGSISYHMSHRVIDMLGLNDFHIARTSAGQVGFARAGHMKGDGRYVLSRKPDYILMGNVAVLPMPLDASQMAGKLVRKSEHELWDDPTFQRDYERVSVPIEDAGIFRYFTFYSRRELGVAAKHAAH